MRIVTQDALCPGIMGVRIYTLESAPVTGFIGQFEVAPQAELPTAINGQADRIIGMIQLRSVTVFAADIHVRRILEVFIIALVALLTGLRALILNRYCFPFGLIALAVKTVHVTLFMDTKIARYQHRSRQQNQCNDA
jgi:hypothetical protein